MLQPNLCEFSLAGNVINHFLGFEGCEDIRNRNDSIKGTLPGFFFNYIIVSHKSDG
jgi:hypothetical protein